VLGLERPDPGLGFDVDLDLPSFSAECLTVTPGEVLGGPGDSPVSEKLQKLTAEKFPDANARPWIEGLSPGQNVP